MDWNVILFTHEHIKDEVKKQEGHDGRVSLHWLIRKIPLYQTSQYLGIGLKCKTPNKD